MTIPPTGGPNRPSSFDFGLGPTTPVDELPSRRALRTTVDTRSIAAPLIIALAVVAVIGGAAATAWYLVSSAEDQVRADSAAFCAALAEEPGSLTKPGFGWPTEGADIATTLGLMKEYQERWETIASVAHPTIAGDAERVAKAAGVITSGIEVSKTIDRPTTITQMDAVTSHTAIVAWADKYCS